MKRPLLFPLLIGLLAVVVLLPASPWLYPTPYTDTSIFLYIGQKINQGLLPFRDVYDHKPPLIFYINALGLWVGGGSRWGVWVLQALSLSAAGWFGFALLRRYTRHGVAFLAICAVLLNLLFVHERGNLTEEYALPFQFGAFFLLSTLDAEKLPTLRLFAIGVLLGMASTLKQPLAGGVIAVGAVLLALAVPRRHARWLVQAASWVALGGLAVWAAWFLYFWAAGGLAEFWEAAFAYNFALSGIPASQRLRAFGDAIGWLVGFSGFFVAGLLAWLAAAAYLGLLVRKPANEQPLNNGWSIPLIIAVVDLPVELLLSSLSGNNFFHYFMPLLPGLAILTAFWIESIGRLVQQSTGRLTGAAWVGALLLPALLPGMLGTAAQMGPRGDRQIEDTAQYVQETTLAGDPILVWGNAAGVYLLAGRDAPGRFFFLDPLFVRGYSGAEQTGPFLRDLQANPPAAIVYQRDVYIPLITAREAESCAAAGDQLVYDQYVQRQLPPEEFVPMPAGMDAIYTWICEHYRYETAVGELGWEIYRWKGSD